MDSPITGGEPARNAGWFKPGNNANPLGRPRRGATLKELINHELEQMDESGKTKKEILISAICKAALKGKESAINTILDRLEGKPGQTVEVRRENPLQDMTDEQIKELLEYARQVRAKTIE